MSRKSEAIAALVELAKDRIQTIDGEWGCCHSYEEALTLMTDADLAYGEVSEPISACSMHDEAVQLRDIIAAATR